MTTMRQLLITSVLCIALSGCSCICPTNPVRIVSNEKNTNIYYNGEFIGSDSTFAILKNYNVEKSTVSGEKKGCTTTTLPVSYGFDMSVLNIVDLRNVVRLLTWDVYIVDKSKDLYNVTPRCK